MSARHLVIGFDGADLSLVYTLGARRLPTLFGLLERGVFAHLQSVEPPATLPNWTTFLTGVDPGVHGVFDFTTRAGYGVAFTGGTVRAAPSLAAYLDALGKRVACVGFPATYPPERLAHGVFVSGWDSPVAFEADASFVWPPPLARSLRRRFGPLTFDEVDQFRADEPGWHARLGARLVDKIERRTELASFLLALRDWDLFAFYFGESDTAAHYLWSLFDEGSPRRPAQVSEAEASGLVRVYEALDRSLARLLEQAGPNVELTVVSDHGSGGSSDKVLFLNRALAAAGLLAFEPQRGAFRPHAGPPASTAHVHLKRWALSGLSPRLRDTLFRFRGGVFPSWLESRTRFAGIDMRRTVAFSDELNYFPAVHLNVRGREPHGQIDPRDLPRVRAEVKAALLALRDPWSDRPVVRAVHEREALYHGPEVARAPDLLLELCLDRGYSYNLVPSSEATEGEVWRRLSPAEFLGKKGRSLPGSHRSRGLFMASGPTIAARGQLELKMADASALLLGRMGIALPAQAAGTVPRGVLGLEQAERPRAVPEVERARRVASNQGRLEARLRALGYID